MRPPGFGNESSAYLVVDLKLLRWMECLGLSRMLLAQLPVRHRRGAPLRAGVKSLWRTAQDALVRLSRLLADPEDLAEDFVFQVRRSERTHDHRNRFNAKSPKSGQ